METLKKEQNNSNLKVTVYWGDILYDSTICFPNQTISIGPAQGNTYVLDPGHPLPSGKFELIKVLPDSSVDVQFQENYRGHIRLGKKIYSFASLKDSMPMVNKDSGVYRFRIAQDEKADIVIGLVSFYLEWVSSKERIAKMVSLKKNQAAPLLLVIGGFLLLIFLTHFIPAQDIEKPPERLVMVVPKSFAKAALGQQQTKEGGAQKGDPGKADLSPQKPPTEAELLRSANVGSVVQNLASLVGTKAPITSNNLAPSTPSTLEQVGNGGFSTEGLKEGAGGKTVGIGRIVGKGEGGFEGTGKLGLSGDSLIEGGTGHGTSSQPEEVGGLDREVIEAIIRRRQDRIRLCYERQLNFSPQLSGKISIHFVIGKAGQVLTSSILEDTMKNQSVSQCVLTEVKSWTFPPPRGGTLVNVDYPFVFESSAKSSY